MKLRHLLLSMALLTLLLLPAAAGAAVTDGLSCPAPSGAAVQTQKVKGQAWLFLPSWTDLQKLTLNFSGSSLSCSANGKSLTVRPGTPFDLTALFPQEPAGGVYTLTVAQGKSWQTLRVMHSENLAALYLKSDSAQKGRAYVEQKKGNKATGSAVMLDADGSVLYQGGLKQIKGRGNSTWGFPKKPYQIKLKDKTDLMGTGEAAGTWVLLAGYDDDTLLHNRYTYDLALNLGMDNAPHCRPVDLYYDGEYRGSYLLSEKTEVGKGRVEVRNLEDAYEAANPNVADMDKLPTASAATSSGNPGQYVSGLTDPEDITGGYLLEVDYSARAKEEKSWFQSNAGKYFVSKSPEYLSKNGLNYISSRWQSLETALSAGGVDPVSGKSYSELIDITSLARCYLLEEFSQDNDAFLSSCYFYLNAGETRFHAGPVWDFDTCYGSDNSGKHLTSSGLTAAQSILARSALSQASFRREVQRCWNQELYPLIQKTLSGSGAGTVTALGREVRASQRMDAVLWPAAAAKDYSSALSVFQTRLQHRSQWLNQEINRWKDNTMLLSTYADLDANAWYGEAVADVTARGLMNGTNEIRFSPNGAMTRSMVVIALHRLSGDSAAGLSQRFSDVTGNSWKVQAAAWASGKGIAAGFENGLFRPDWSVDRQQLAVFLYRYAKLQGADLSGAPLPEKYLDRGQVEPWAREAMEWAVYQGLINGTTEQTLSPAAGTNRVQGAAMLQRFARYLEAQR